MDKDDTIERLRSCRVMESVCSSVYHLLSLNFPGEKELWNKLAMDEESHAEMIAEVTEYKDIENIAHYPIPQDLTYVKKTVESADDMRMLLINDKLSLKDALVRLRSIHELKNKSYAHDLLGNESEERIKRVYRTLFETEEANRMLLRSFMVRFGVL
jgi:hypothetical protein